MCYNCGIPGHSAKQFAPVIEEQEEATKGSGKARTMEEEKAIGIGNEVLGVWDNMRMMKKKAMNTNMR